MSLRVRVVERADEAPAELWTAGFAPPLEGVWWYRALEASGLEAQFTFRYAIVEEDGRPVGLAPLFVADIPMELVVPAGVMALLRIVGMAFPAVLNQRTLFVGSPFSDEGTVAIAPGADRVAVLVAIARALEPLARRHKALMLAWKDFPEVHRAEMEAMSEAAGFFPSVSFPGTLVRFRSPKRADYESNLKPSHRYNLRRRVKRGRALVELTSEVVQGPDDKALDKIFALFRQTFEKSDTQFERLDRRFFEVFAKLPEAWFVILREPERGEMVAFMLCLKSGDRVINKFIGLDYRRGRDWMLYFRLWDAAVEWTLGVGARELQSGQTGYRAKIEIGHDLVPLWNYGRHRIAPVHWIYALVGRTISWASLDPQLVEKQ